MMKRIFIFITVIFPIDILGQGLDCFTHPQCGCPIALFSRPSACARLRDLNCIEEAGYEVEALRTENGYILLSHLTDENEYVWVKIGDVGVVIQNYDNFSIPIYTEPDSLSTIQTYLLESYVAIFYDWNKDFVRVCVKVEKAEWIGWINRRYICGSPYTTCN